jgi:hypothetical protein
MRQKHGIGHDSIVHCREETALAVKASYCDSKDVCKLGNNGGGDTILQEQRRCKREEG